MHKSRTNTNCQRQFSQPPVPVRKSMQSWGGGWTCLSEFITPVLSETLPLNLKKAAPGCVVSGIRVFVWPFCAFVWRWPFVSISGPRMMLVFRVYFFETKVLPFNCSSKIPWLDTLWRKNSSKNLVTFRQTLQGRWVLLWLHTNTHAHFRLSPHNQFSSHFLAHLASCRITAKLILRDVNSLFVAQLSFCFCLVQPLLVL